MKRTIRCNEIILRDELVLKEKWDHVPGFNADSSYA